MQTVLIAGHTLSKTIVQDNWYLLHRSTINNLLDIISCLAKYSSAIHWSWVVLINLSLIIGAFSLSQLDYVN